MADETKNRSRARWRQMGFYVENAEFFVKTSPGVNAKKDLFGFADLVAVPKRKPHPLVFIQATSWDHVPTRLKKIQTQTTGRGQYEVALAELARGILLAGQRIVIEGWRKEGRLWCRHPRIHWITQEDLR